MLSKALQKRISALENKKQRKESGLFVAEGGKTVLDLINSGLKVDKLIATHEWLQEHELPRGIETIEVSNDEMRRASFQQAPQGVLAIFHQPEEQAKLTVPCNELCLALDNVQDPGNLGTIIRIADWFGIKNIFCSIGTADVYNPKTIQATMGAIGRVRVHYLDLPEYIASLKDKTPIYGTFLDGENIYGKELCNKGLIIMGNEGNGISKECSALVNERLFIPNYPAGCETSESLNVSVATAIICSEFRRRIEQ
ncbi:MAG: RNA methyltransferase [Bacteroidaceae bacterium]|nr:RNA methyltransferase [Bacteroidaceae bacterium]